MLESKFRKLPTLPNPELKTHILTLLEECKSVHYFKQIHTQMLINSFHHPNRLLSKIIALQDLPYSTLIFTQIPHPNDFAYNILIRGLATFWKKSALAVDLYLKMTHSDQKPNNYTFPFVLHAFGNLQYLNSGRAIHSSICKSGLEPDLICMHSLITMYSKCRQLGLARKVFDEISVRDSVSWNSMISGYSKMGFAKDAVGLFRRMRAEGFELDAMTLTSVLTSCGDLGDLSLGEELAGVVEAKGLEVISFVGSALVNMYGKCGDLVSARRVFDGIRKKDLVVWNAMITGYAQNGLSEEAITLFRNMRASRTEPDERTMVVVLSACASVGTLDVGSWVDEIASRKGLHRDVYVGTALIDMHAKSGNLDRAVQIFEAITKKNIVSWNAMISALAFHGQGHDAINLFSRMVEKEGFPPDGITFIHLLTACVHTGLVEEGRQWFNSMEQKFGIVPEIEHYSCMVDLLARAGRLEEAWEFIENMEVKPDAVMLGALQSACRNFRNVRLGDSVTEKLLELEPSNSGNYVISSKMHAASKRWEDSARMRGLMRERGVSKTPGCSWMEVGDQVHEFHAGDDGSHPRVLEINSMVGMLVQEMKLEGYIPNTHLI